MYCNPNSLLSIQFFFVSGPKPPPNFRVTDTSDIQITVEWDAAPSSIVHQYMLTYDPPTGQPASPSVIFPFEERLRTITNLMSNTQYTFTLVAVSGTVSGQIETTSTPVTLRNGRNFTPCITNLLSAGLTQFTCCHHQNNLGCAILVGNATFQWSAHLRRCSVYTSAY